MRILSIVNYKLSNNDVIFYIALAPLVQSAYLLK
jgi:hypothetical protein